MEPIQKKSNSTMYAVVSIVVLIIILVLVMSHKKDDSMTDESMVGDTTEDTSMPSGTVSDPNKEGLSTGSNAGKYADLVLKYQDRTLQFDESCQVSKESTAGFKQGTDVLLDNRGPESAKIILGSRTVNLPGYGYKVMDLGSVGSFQVDCNDRQNVLTVTVQK